MPVYHTPPRHARTTTITTSACRTYDTQPYLPPPDRLLADYTDSPRVIGAWIACLRLCLVARGAVPLSAPDLAAWTGGDPTADRVPLMRDLLRLEADGWLQIERTPGCKHRILATWGRSQDGTPILCDCTQPRLGRPAHQRGPHIPLALLDLAWGQLTPTTGNTRALIRRYLSHPLLDLADVGAYALGLRAHGARPTPRLRHLHLWGDAGSLPSPCLDALLLEAAGGSLTTLDAHGATLPVALTAAGYARMGLPDPATRSTARSTTRSSANRPPPAPAATSPDSAVIAWEDGSSQSIKTDPPPLHDTSANARAGGGSSVVDGDDTQPHIGCDPLVLAGHRALNPDRAIPPGEWLELTDLHAQHGARALLIWQARAQRAGHTFVAPGYYTRCAASDDLAAQRRRPTPAAMSLDLPPDVPATLRPPRAPAPPAIDPVVAEALRALGFKKLDKLAAVTLDEVQRWTPVLAHPGWQSRWRDPLAAAHWHLAERLAPPAPEELDRWVAYVRGFALTVSSSADTLPATIQALDVAAYLDSLGDPPPPEIDAILPPLDRAACRCGDGSGSYYTRRADGSVQVWACPCRRPAQTAAYLEQAAGPGLAAARLSAFRTDDRQLDPVAWGGQVVAPEDQRRTLRAAVTRCAEAVRDRRGVALLGPAGSGKTTLAVATGAALANRCGLSLRFMPVTKLLAELRREIGEHAVAETMQRLLATQVLILDDLGREAPTRFAREHLHRLLDERNRLHTPNDPRITIITSNLTAAELYATDAPLAGRIAQHANLVLCIASDARIEAPGAHNDHPA